MTYANGVVTKIRFERGCGFRKAGGFYLFGDKSAGISLVCDRLPLEIPTCPRCGETIRFSRGIQEIDFLNIFENHNELIPCKCPKNCPACYPETVLPSEDGEDCVNTWLMWVGQDYTTDSFVDEAQRLGTSKRIPYLPKGFRIGADWVFLARHNGGKRTIAVEVNGRVTRMSDVIFYAYRPTALELIITEDQAKDQEYIDNLLERGITPIVEFIPCDIHAEDEDPEDQGRGSQVNEESLGKTEKKKGSKK